MIKRKFVFAFLCLGVAVSAFGQDNRVVATEPTNSVMNQTKEPQQQMDNRVVEQQNSVTTGQPQASQPTEQPSDNATVSLDFRDADIKNVLQILAFKSGVNIVTGPEVTGNVTIQLKDVPWQQALEVVLQTYGYASDRKGNVITVTTIEDLKKRREDALILSQQEVLETKTFTLNFGKASEIIASIEKVKSDRGTLNFDERTNTLIITDTPSRLALMAGVIKTLDRTTPQVLIEGKIVETQLSNSDKLGIDWTVKVTLSGAKRPVTYPFGNSTSDKFAPGSFGVPTSSLFTFGTLDASQFAAVLEMLRTRSDTNILSNPRITTLDNQPAQIVVGSQYPIPSYTYNENQAKLQVSGWEYKDIGIIFNVTPHVNLAGFVTMDIEPRITEIQGYVTVESTSLPQLSNESAKTRVMVKSGETLVIGGLLKDKTVDTKKKVPFLGDIPIAGAFFTKKDNTIAKTDLLIFMTPHIITPEVPAN